MFYVLRRMDERIDAVTDIDEGMEAVDAARDISDDTIDIERRDTF